MSSPYFIGTATAIAQVATITPAGSITTGDVNNIPVKNENNTVVTTVSFTTTGTTTATAVSAGLIAAWNSNPIASQYATASGTATVVLTAANAGVPFYVTSNVTGSGTLTTVATTASSGPSNWGAAANWSTGSVPITSDSVLIDPRGQSPILYGLNQSAVTLASLTVMPGAPYVGQSSIPLQISSTVVSVPRPNGTNLTGVNRLNINLGSVQTAVNVQYTSPASPDAGLEPVRIAGANSSNAITIGGGLVGIGTNLPTDTPQFPSITVNGGTVNLGPGLHNSATLTAVSGLVNANNRPGGNIFSSLVLAGPTPGTGAVVDFSGNVAVFTVASVTMGNGQIRVASSAQGTFTAMTPSFGNQGNFVAQIS